MVPAILKTSTFRQSVLTSGATIVNGLLGMLFYVLAARFLGPSDFGLLVISITVLTLTADIADFGTNSGLVKFIPGLLNSQPQEAMKVLKLSLKIKAAVWLAVLILGILLAPFTASYIFGKQALTLPLRLVTVGVGGAMFFSFATSALQAFQKFSYWSVINIAANLTRVILLVLLVVLGVLNLLSGLVIYILLPFLGFFLALLVLPAGKFLTVSNENSVWGKVFSYNRRVAIFTLVAAVSARLDMILVARLLSSAEVGIYGAANQLVSAVPQVVAALGTVAAPKFAGFTSVGQMLTYLKKLQLMVGGLALAALTIIPLSYYLIPAIFGLSFEASVPVFIILLAAMLVFLLSLPVHTSLIYYFGKPEVFIWASLLHLLVVAVLGYILISSFGAMGAALTVLAGMVLNLLVPLGWFFYLVKRKR